MDTSDAPSGGAITTTDHRPMTHEIAALIAHGFIAQPRPTKAQLATMAAAKAALEQFRRQWSAMPVPTR